MPFLNQIILLRVLLGFLHQGFQPHRQTLLQGRLLSQGLLEMVRGEFLWDNPYVEVRGLPLRGLPLYLFRFPCFWNLQPFYVAEYANLTSDRTLRTVEEVFAVVDRVVEQSTYCADTHI